MAPHVDEGGVLEDVLEVIHFARQCLDPLGRAPRAGFVIPLGIFPRLVETLGDAIGLSQVLLGSFAPLLEVSRRAAISVDLLLLQLGLAPAALAFAFALTFPRGGHAPTGSSPASPIPSQARRRCITCCFGISKNID